MTRILVTLGEETQSLRDFWLALADFEMIAVHSSAFLAQLDNVFGTLRIAVSFIIMPGL